MLDLLSEEGLRRKVAYRARRFAEVLELQAPQVVVEYGWNMLNRAYYRMDDIRRRREVDEAPDLDIDEEVK